MATAKTWLWIIVGFVALCLLGLVVIAGAGVYFVSHHIDSKAMTSAEAARTFDAMRATFKTAPLLELDEFGRPHAPRRLADMPASATKPENLWILTWDPEEERVLKLSIPFWMLRLGRQKSVMMSGDRNFDINRLNLDVQQLDRIGPVLVLDYRKPSGERVLVWTQ